MSDIGKTALKNKIDAKIYDNESQLITGAILNEVLQDAVDTLADGGNLDAGSVDTANLNDEAVTKGKLEQNVSADLDWAVASNSYYRNSQAGDVAAKVITTYKNMNLIGGGSLKVTFENVNTADDATLNIDGKGAKPLYYNGARVSSTNSWEAGETVEIYYNNYTTGIYYAKRWMVEPVSVSQNSQTGHTEITVGDTTTPVASLAESDTWLTYVNTINLQSYTPNDGRINGTNWEIPSSQYRKYIIVPVADFGGVGNKVRILPNPNGQQYNIHFLSEYNPINGSDAHSLLYVYGYAIQEVIVPEGTTYVYVYYQAGNYSRLPEQIVTKDAIMDLSEDIDELSDKIDAGAKFGGYVTPTDSPTDTNLCYLTTTAGTYTNFGGVVVLLNALTLLHYVSNSWKAVKLANVRFRLFSNAVPNINSTTHVLDLGPSPTVIIESTNAAAINIKLATVHSEDTSLFRAISLTNTSSDFSLILFDVSTATFRAVSAITYVNPSEIIIGIYSKRANADVTYFDFTYNVDGYRLKQSQIYQDVQPSTTGILDLNPIDVIIPKITNLKRNYNDYGSSPSLKTPCLTLLHCSDIHGDNTNLLRIKEFADAYADYIDGLLQTGDYISNYWSQGLPTDANQLPKLMGAIGNHDAMDRIGTPPNHTWVLKDAADVYATVFAPYISQWGVTYTADLCYYYKDYPTNNVRLIVLDSMHWDAAQLSWLETALNGAKTNGYHVICATHYPPFNAQKQPTNPFDAISINMNTSGDLLNSQAATAVKNFIDADGVFVCWLSGHIHSDVMGVGPIGSGFENQLAISIACAAVSNADNFSEMARSVGNRTQDCFNLVSVDTNDKTLKLMRIGANYDRYMRRRNTLSWDYDNSQIIYVD